MTAPTGSRVVRRGTVAGTERVKPRESGAGTRGVVRRGEIRTVEDACPYRVCVSIVHDLIVGALHEAPVGADCSRRVRCEGRGNTSSVTHSRATFPHWGRQKYSALFDKTFCG